MSHPDQSPTRKIVHIDMDAFYASVEQRDQPELRGKPVAVGSPARRGVVAAASYEARAWGVHSATPSATALRRCPSLVFMPPRFPVYRRISAEIHAIFHMFTDLVEPLSLDEAYLDVTENKPGLASAIQIARLIRQRIREETHLTASAGISYNKFLAKTASALNKPNGQAVILPADGPVFMARLPIARFHGIGPATAAKMHQLGIETGADLRARSPGFLRSHFGKAGWRYYQLARGIDTRPVEPNRPRKSVGSEDTFGADIFAYEEAAREASRLLAHITDLCWRRHLFPRTITLKVRYTDFQQLTRSKTWQTPTLSNGMLEQYVLALLHPLFPTEKGIRLLGVTLSSFAEGDALSESIQPDFWDTTEAFCLPPDRSL